MPQAANQRPNGQRPYRQQSQSQVIPAGNSDVRQMNYAAPLGLQRDRRNGRNGRNDSYSPQ